MARELDRGGEAGLGAGSDVGPGAGGAIRAPRLWPRLRLRQGLSLRPRFILVFAAAF